MEYIVGLALQFAGELLLQIAIEQLAGLGAYSLADTLDKPRSAVLSTFGFLLWGAIAGGISLLVLPQSLISSPLPRKCNVLATPLAAGAVMALVGRRRGRKGLTLVRFDRFGYAFAFALAMAVVRYIWAS